MNFFRVEIEINNSLILFLKKRITFLSSKQNFSLCNSSQYHYYLFEDSLLFLKVEGSKRSLHPSNV